MSSPRKGRGRVVAVVGGSGCGGRQVRLRDRLSETRAQPSFRSPSLRRVVRAPECDCVRSGQRRFRGQRRGREDALLDAGFIFSLSLGRLLEDALHFGVATPGKGAWSAGGPPARVMQFQAHLLHGAKVGPSHCTHVSFPSGRFVLPRRVPSSFVVAAAKSQSSAPSILLKPPLDSHRECTP